MRIILSSLCASVKKQSESCFYKNLVDLFNTSMQNTFSQVRVMSYDNCLTLERNHAFWSGTVVP